jgi:hypothetical protein
VFVDHPAYPRPGGLYADKNGTYGDNQVGGWGGWGAGGADCRVLGAGSVAASCRRAGLALWVAASVAPCSLTQLAAPS